MKVKIVSTVETMTMIYDWIFPVTFLETAQKSNHSQSLESILKDDWSIVECGFDEDLDQLYKKVDCISLTNYGGLMWEILEISNRDGKKLIKKFPDFVKEIK